MFWQPRDYWPLCRPNRLMKIRIRKITSKFLTETWGAFEMATSAGQVRAMTTLNDLPLTVFSQDSDKDCLISGNQAPLESERAWQTRWVEMQAELVAFSSNSTLVIATNACHGVPTDNPKVIAEEIQKILAAVSQ